MKNCKILLSEDFNIDISKNALYAKKIKGVLEKYDMIQLVNDYTRISEKRVEDSVKISRTIIDYIICNRADKNLYLTVMLDIQVHSKKNIPNNLGLTKEK